MILIHVLSLLIIAHSFKTYDLRIPIHSNHAIDHFKPIKEREKAKKERKFPIKRGRERKKKEKKEERKSLIKDRKKIEETWRMVFGPDNI